MSACIWYISKYIALPRERKWSIRAFSILREVVKAGNRCVIITSDSNHLTNPTPVHGTHEREVVDGVEVTWLRTKEYRGAKSLSRIVSWIDFEWRLWRLPKQDLPRPDAIIVSSLSLLTIFNGLLLRRRYGSRLIFEVRDIWPLTIIEEGGFSPRNPFVMALAWVERLAYRRSDAIVGTMPNLAQHVAEVAGPTAAPVYCIPMGVDDDAVEQISPLPADYVQAHIPQGRFIVCHAGTIGITNALETLFACARAMQDRKDIHFLLVGEGGLKEQFRQECADLRNVTFAPGVPKNMVPSVLSHCDLLYFSVHRSKIWSFGQSLNKVIDYMLAAKPVLASYTGYPSMINEAGSGSYVPAGNVALLKAEIERYAEMPEAQRLALGSAGRKWLLENRRYEKLGQDYLTLCIAPIDRNLAAESTDNLPPR